MLDAGRHLPAQCDRASGRSRPYFHPARRPHRRQTHTCAPPVFLQLETSPGNFQAWLAIAGRVEKDFGTRLKRGTGADVNASGATRIAGSMNFKEKYHADFPRVSPFTRRMPGG